MRNVIKNKGKDKLLYGENLKFSIDEIIMLSEKEFLLNVIPDTKSVFNPPYHLRKIKITYELLEKTYYNYVLPKSKHNENHFKGSVIQGGYYSIPTEAIKNIDLFNTDKVIINAENNIFDKSEAHILAFNEEEIAKNKIKGDREYEHLNCKNNVLNNVYLYCFNVGQGDSALLITSSGSAYLIDSNFVDVKMANKIVDEIKSILKKHKLKSKELKGVIITHKHLDHIRGLKYVLDNDLLKFENLLINCDYIHSTKAVYDLLKSANTKIPNWININKPGVIKEGDTYIVINNPGKDTFNCKVCPDINNSSIGLEVIFHKSIIYMTGDLSFNIINKKFGKCICRLHPYHKCNNINNFTGVILKVSHHGSITGTDVNVLRNLNPGYAFISAGTSKKYKHPHNIVVNSIMKNAINLKISKKEKKTICYEVSMNSIIVK